MSNTAAFARPSRLDPGNTPRDVYRGPGIDNWDLIVTKRIPLAPEYYALEFRWEFYNIFNHTQFRGPVGGDAPTSSDGVGFDPAFASDRVPSPQVT